MTGLAGASGREAGQGEAAPPTTGRNPDAMRDLVNPQ